MTMHRFRCAPSSRFRPRTEILEDRCCPAVGIAVLGRIMFILGDSSANTVKIADQGDGNIEASITSSTNTASRTAANINSIVVLAGNGADMVDYQLAKGLNTARALLIDLGRGADTANLNASAGVDQSAFLATVLGGDDADAITADVGSIAEGAYAGLALDGGRGIDTVNATFAGTLNGTLALGVAGGLNNDTVAAKLTIDAGSTGSLAVAALGGAGDDALTLTVEDNSGGEGDSTLEFQLAVLDGGTGTDSCIATDNVEVFNCES